MRLSPLRTENCPENKTPGNAFFNASTASLAAFVAAFVFPPAASAPSYALLYAARIISTGTRHLPARIASMTAAALTSRHAVECASSTIEIRGGGVLIGWWLASFPKRLHEISSLPLAKFEAVRQRQFH